MNLIQYKSSSNTAKNCAYILLEQLKKKKTLRIMWKNLAWQKPEE